MTLNIYYIKLLKDNSYDKQRVFMKNYNELL